MLAYATYAPSAMKMVASKPFAATGSGRETMGPSCSIHSTHSSSSSSSTFLIVYVSSASILNAPGLANELTKSSSSAAKIWTATTLTSTSSGPADENTTTRPSGMSTSVCMKSISPTMTSAMSSTSRPQTCLMPMHFSTGWNTETARIKNGSVSGTRMIISTAVSSTFHGARRIWSSSKIWSFASA